LYEELNRNPYDFAQALMRGCPTTVTVRDCLVNMVGTSAASFRPQGTTGVRFFFGPEWYSTAIDRLTGTVRPVWRAKLRLFLQDLRKFGVVRITPTPSPGPHDRDPNLFEQQTVASCGGMKTLRFYPQEPFGREQQDAVNWWPERCNGGTDYGSAAPNTVNFAGWNRFFDVVEATVEEAKLAGLDIVALDYYNELPIDGFPVTARMIYDNKTGTDVLGAVRNSPGLNGFNPDAALLSVTQIAPAEPGVNDQDAAGRYCDSPYGGSALLHNMSAFFDALRLAPFGNVPFDAQNGLPCADPLLPISALAVQEKMNFLYFAYPKPSALDIHSQSYFSTTSRTQANAVHLHRDVRRNQPGRWPVLCTVDGRSRPGVGEWL